MKIHLVTALVIILSKVRKKFFLITNSRKIRKKKTKKKNKLPQSNQYINTKDNLPKKEVI